MEVYGFIKSADKLQSEEYLGSLELLNVRKSYPMGKRATETLCYCFFKEKNIPVKIVHLAQTIGTNIDYDVLVVYAHFARSIVEKRDIILSAYGNTRKSYCYITNTIIAILLLLQKIMNN